MRRILVTAFAMLVFVTPAGADDPLKVVFVSGSFLYESDKVLGKFKEWLEDNYPVSVTLVSATDWDDLPGLEALDTCDVALFYTRRLRIDGEQLQRIKDYAASGKPIVAVRTASHGFQNWLAFDKEVLGGDYGNHFPEGPATRVVPVGSHPILEGIGQFGTTSTLYRNPEIAADCTVLLRGTMDPRTSSIRLPNDLGPEESWTQPVAWVRDRNPGRVFYTSLGAEGDFEHEPFKRLIANALYWAASSTAPSPSAVGAGGSRSDIR